MNNTFSEINQEILKAKNVLMCLHVKPDMDSIGSNLALGEYLKYNNINFTVISADKVPEDTLSKFLDDAKNIKVQTDPATIDLNQFDLFLGCDYQVQKGFSKIPDFKFPSSIKKVCLDHHIDNELYGDLNFVDTNFSSNCGLIYKFFKEVNYVPNSKAQRFLFLGILSDTGLLTNKSVKKEDYIMCAELIDLGLNLSDIIYEFTFNVSLENMIYRSIIYGNLKKDLSRNLAYSYSTNEQKISKGLNPLKPLSEKGSDCIKYLSGIKFVFFLDENPTEAGSFILSVRSHDINFDSTILAAAFNGGGHKMAAGGELKNQKNIEDAINTVLKKYDELESQGIY